jgi:hypothetical protein
MNSREPELPEFIASELKIYWESYKKNQKQNKGNVSHKSNKSSIDKATCINKLVALKGTDRKNPFLLYQCFAENPPNLDDAEYPVYRAVLFVISRKPGVQVEFLNQKKRDRLEKLAGALHSFTEHNLNKSLFPLITQHKHPDKFVDALIILQTENLLDDFLIQLISSHTNPVEAANGIIKLYDKPDTKKHCLSILSNRSPDHAATALQLLSRENQLQENKYIDRIVTHIDPNSAANAYLDLKNAAVDKRIFSAFINDALQSNHPHSAAKGLLSLHEKLCDSNKNKEAFLSICNHIDKADEIIAAINNRNEIESILHHPMKYNLMKILLKLQNSDLLTPVNIEILLAQANSTLLDDKFFKSVWQHQKKSLTQHDFNKILAHMKFINESKNIPHPKSSRIRLGFIRKSPHKNLAMDDDQKKTRDKSPRK